MADSHRPMSFLPAAPADRLLALAGLAGVGVAFMEPRAFWLGASICYLTAIIALHLHRQEFKRLISRIYTRRNLTDSPPHLGFATLLIIFCIGTPIYLYVTKADPLLNYGVLSQLMYQRFIARFFEAPPKPQIGNSKVFFAPTDPAAPLILIAQRDRLRVDSVRGKIKVSTKITDETGQLVAEIINNEWHVSSQAWDRNYNDNSLEILDSKGDVALQITMLPGVIQLQGYWWIDLGPPNGIERFYILYTPGVTGFSFVPLNHLAPPPQISPIFKYPSPLHPGELK